MSEECANGRRRTRLLEWMRGGDPSLAPVMMMSVDSLAASYYGIGQAKVTPELAAQAAAETHTQGVTCVGSPLPFDAIDFTDKLSRENFSETLADGTVRHTTRIGTPSGTMQQVFEQPPDIGGYHREHLVKDEGDIPAFESLVRIGVETILRNSDVREAVTERMKRAKAAAAGAFPTEIHVFCPAVELMSCYYMGQPTAIYLVHDHRQLMEELFDIHWRMTEVWLECAREVGVDIYNYAINGLEWLSPELYERYMIPQARRINEWARSLGKLSWLHTCGKKSGLIELGVYRRMGVDILESFSAPPTGDILDIAAARRGVDCCLATRGGINVEMFYADDVERLKERAREVLDGAAGYRHMIGDTNDSFPPYPMRNIQALIDVVRERGCLFE